MKLVIKILVGAAILSYMLHGTEYRANLLYTIGDERDDYTFFKIRSAVIAQDGATYIGDVGGYFVAKYDARGKFVKRFGRAGQGPKEFLFIDSLRLFDGYLYLSDIKNLRIAKIDNNLNEMTTFRLGAIQLRGDFHVISGDRYFATFSDIKDSRGRGRAAIFNKTGDIERCFFTKDQWGEHKSERDELNWAIKMITGQVLAGYSSKWQEFVIGFEYPTPPAAYYVYGTDGKERCSFSVEQAAVVCFPEYKLHYPFKIKKNHNYLRNKSIVCYKDYILVFYNVIEANINMEEKIVETACVVLDRTGKKVGLTELPVGQSVFDVNAGGMMVSANTLEEIPKLYIHQLLF